MKNDPSNTKDCEILRALDEADMASLDRPPVSKTPPLKKLRESHHILARCVALGGSLAEISRLTGYSQSRISILKGDPAFAELVSFYHKKEEEYRDEVQRDHYARMCALHGDIAEEIHDRVLETPELVSFGDMFTAWEKTADRIGLGPTHKSVNTNLNVNLADRVAAGRLRARELSADPSDKVGLTSSSEGDRKLRLIKEN